MWIVKLALDRPYTFVVLALLILLLSPLVILSTPTDIFPTVNLPVVAVSWIYTGMNAEELEGRLTTVYEKVLTALVDNIEHIESTTVGIDGLVRVKIFLQPNASVDRANAQVTAASQSILRQLPPGTLPPEIVNYTASNVPVLQLALSGQGLSEADLNDLALNFLRHPAGYGSRGRCAVPLRREAARDHGEPSGHASPVERNFTAGCCYCAQHTECDCAVGHRQNWEVRI